MPTEKYFFFKKKRNLESTATKKESGATGCPTLWSLQFGIGFIC